VAWASGKLCKRSLLLAYGQQRVVLAVCAAPYPRRAGGRAAREARQSPPSFADEQDVPAVAVEVHGERLPVGDRSAAAQLQILGHGKRSRRTRFGRGSTESTKRCQLGSYPPTVQPGPGGSPQRKGHVSLKLVCLLLFTTTSRALPHCLG
jgi:hypothetical protein